MLYLSELAWVKLIWFRDHCCAANFEEDSKDNSFNEVSLMGISASEDALNQIVNFVCIKQEASAGETIIDDNGLADYFDMMREEKQISPKRCGRVWFHTHPGKSSQPSSVDEETYTRFFKDVDFAVMGIIAIQNTAFCRMKYDSIIGTVTQNVDIVVMKGKEPIFVHELLAIHSKIEDLKLDYNKLLYSRYMKHFPDWLQEMKDNVSKKKFVNHFNYHGQNYNYGRGASNQYVNSFAANNEFQKQLPAVYKEKINHKKSTPRIIDNIIDAIATGGHKMLHDLPEQKMRQLLFDCGCDQKDLYHYMAQIRKYEEKFNIEEWIGLVDTTGFLHKTLQQQIVIAQTIGVRVGFLKDLFKKGVA